jgi:hypothetical protein
LLQSGCRHIHLSQFMNLSYYKLTLYSFCVKTKNTIPINFSFGTLFAKIFPSNFSNWQLFETPRCDDDGNKINPECFITSAISQSSPRVLVTLNVLKYFDSLIITKILCYIYTLTKNDRECLWGTEHVRGKVKNYPHFCFPIYLHKSKGWTST